MNERVKELIRQSAVPADQAEDYALAKGLIEPTEKLDVVKFAELIVAEMLQTCEDHPGWSGRMIGEQIKQDFGVKEC